MDHEMTKITLCLKRPSLPRGAPHDHIFWAKFFFNNVYRDDSVVANYYII